MGTYQGAGALVAINLCLQDSGEHMVYGASLHSHLVMVTEGHMKFFTVGLGLHMEHACTQHQVVLTKLSRGFCTEGSGGSMYLHQATSPEEAWMKSNGWRP